MSRMAGLHRQGANLHSEGRHPSAAAGTAPPRTLVPSGFECVAHPVFFRYGNGEGTAATQATLERGPRRRTHDESTLRLTAAPTSVAPVTTSSRRNHPDIAALSSLEGDGLDDGGNTEDSKNRADPRSGGRHPSGKRELDVVCPICLERLEMPVTLTSCLHTFCHACILGWYEHTVAVALRRGDFSRLNAPGSVGRQQGFRYDEQNTYSTDSIDGSSSSSIRARASSGSGSPEPYRCPLCKVPGPYFLAVELARPGPSNCGTDPKKRPKLNFKLMGARTVLGGGGPASGGVVVRHEEGGSGVGYPSMVELRAAGRTQLALAAAVSALDEKRSQEGPLQGSGGRSEAASLHGDGSRSACRGRQQDRGERRKTRKRHRRSTMVASGDEDNSQESFAALEEEHAQRYPEESLTSVERADDSGGDYGRKRKTERARTNEGVFRGELPWEPGAMAAEDALEAIEVMLAREREKLRRSGGNSTGGA